MLGKFSAAHIESVLSQMKYKLIGYAYESKTPLDITMDYLTADPGAGRMVDCLIIKANGPSRENSNKETSMTAEIFAVSEGQRPRISYTESWILEKD